MLAVSAVSFSSADPLGGLQISERPEPDAKPGWTKVTMRASTLNRHDLWSLKGVGLRREQLPRILGCDGAGIDEFGNEVIIHNVVTSPGWSGPAPLDPKRSMLSENFDGTFASTVLVPTFNLVPKPAEMSWTTAACCSLTMLTAYRMLFVQAGLRPGDLVLIQGAGGGVNSAAIQLAAAAGIRVWATSRDEHRRMRALGLGAEQAFESGARLPEKVDAVIDNVGKATWSHSINVLRSGGTLVTCGATTGEPEKTELTKIFFRELRVHGSTSGSIDDLRNLASFVQTAGITPVIDQELPLAQARRAFARMEAGEIFGKIAFTY